MCLVAALGLGLSLAQFHHNNNNDAQTKRRAGGGAVGRSTIVHLFEWRWKDIAEECERYLGPNGFDGVQISPPSENVVVTKPWRPWWERYQPVSYKLCSRSGTEEELRDMVCRCNNAGVKIYADVVINHMCSSGAGEGGEPEEGEREGGSSPPRQQKQQHVLPVSPMQRQQQQRQQRSTCGSYFNTSARAFPSVPYTARHFNDERCTTASGDIESYQDVDQVRNCRLVGLLDLAQDQEDVRARIARYMNSLLDVGVAGFRVDACKHMWPCDLEVIYGRLNDLNTAWFPPGSRPLIYQEVIDLGGEPVTASQYFGLGLVTEFKYGAMLGSVIRRGSGEKLSDLKSWGEGSGLMPSEHALVFVDNHDNQRGHGAAGSSILTFWEPRMFKMAVVFMLAHPYGQARVMSSYRWDRRLVDGKDVNDWMGPPSLPDGSTQPVVVQSDGSCAGGWVCEHRWPAVRNMVAFRRVAGDEPLCNWWDNGKDQIAFGRGGRGFVAINNDDRDMDVVLQTGLPPGTYCDIISGHKVKEEEAGLMTGGCSGRRVTVDGEGRARFTISVSENEPMVALHTEAKL